MVWFRMVSEKYLFPKEIFRFNLIDKKEYGLILLNSLKKYSFVVFRCGGQFDFEDIF